MTEQEKQIQREKILQEMEESEIRLEKNNSLGRFLDVAPSTVYRVLTGMQEPRKAFIDKLLAATGIKYEKAFGR